MIFYYTDSYYNKNVSICCQLSLRRVYIIVKIKQRIYVFTSYFPKLIKQKQLFIKQKCISMYIKN